MVKVVPEPEIYFIITSAGRAATYWLSRILNRSDDIFCMHGYYPVSELPPGEKNAPDDFGQMDEIVDVSRLDGSSRSDAEWQSIVQARWDWFDKLSIDDYFDAMKKVHKVRAYGNVHGYTYDTLISKVKNSKPRHTLRYVNLTRHPVSRAESFYRRFETTAKWVTYSGETFAQRKALARKLRDHVRTRFDVDIYDDDKWLFPDTMLRMLVQYAEATFDDIPHIRAEAVTSDQELFRKFFSGLTNRRIELPTDILEDESFSRRLNRTQRDPLTPEQQFAAWEPWQRYVFRSLIGKEWLAGYDRIGYDVSFVFGKE